MRTRPTMRRRDQRHRLPTARTLAMLLLLAACGGGEDPDASEDESGSTTQPGTTPPPADSTEAGTAPVPGDCDFSETFDTDASSWPAPWQVAGNVATADVQGGRGRLVPNTNAYSLARIFVPLSCTDVEGTLSFEFTDATTQGMGLYLRQNGGYLEQTSPVGQGYAAFVESFRDPAGIGVWREVDGHEEQLGGTTPAPLQAGLVYRVRFRVTQDSPTETRLQARVWPDGEAEPAQWQAETTDSFPGLQGTAGGLAIDAWSSLTSGQASVLFIDDIEITAAQ